MAATPSTSQSPGQTTPPSPTLSQLPPIPGSPNFSLASTANPLSSYHLPLPPAPPSRPAPAILTKSDLALSQQAYADLLSSAKTYRQALAALGTASSTFGASLEACARLKEARAEVLLPDGAQPPAPSNAFQSSSGGGSGGGGGGGGGGGLSCTADALLGAGGVQHLVANHVQILSEAVYRAFEVPLLHELDRWRAAVEDEDAAYTRAATAQGREIRRLEKEGVRLHRQRGRKRDLAQFRSHLVDLTTKLDGLTLLHGRHTRALLRECQEASVRIVDASCSLVRAEVDIFESLARKGWSGGGLEELLERGTDLFATDDAAAAAAVESGSSNSGGGRGGGGGSDAAKLFSILPPRSILADNASDTTTRPAHHGRADSLHVDTERYQSLAGAMGGGGCGSDAGGGRDSDSLSVFSEFNRSRGVVRPFSPPPQLVETNPQELIVARLEEHAAAGAAASTARAALRDKDEEEGNTDREAMRQQNGHDQQREHDDLALPSGSNMIRLGGEEKDLEAHQVWSNVTPRKLTLGRFDTGSAASLTSSHLRERRWSVTNEGEDEEHEDTVD
jgi:hypothetical protein